MLTVRRRARSRAALTPSAPADRCGAEAVPRAARVWVGMLLALLLVPGIIGFDLWPLTGWRMYSAATDATRVDWEIEALTPEGAVPLRWSEMPLAYRLAAWPLATLPAASPERRERVCLALLDGILKVVPDASAAAIVRDRHTLTDEGHIATERQRFHECGRG